MGTFVVHGGIPLSGEIAVAGNKNEALPLIAASLLFDAPVTLRNIPDIGDVRGMLRIAEHLGAEVSAPNKGRVVVDPRGMCSSSLPLELSTSIRGSVLFASALLTRTGRAVLPRPGGDTIGRRRIDTHLLVLAALGARVRSRRVKSQGAGEYLAYTLEAPGGLRGAKIYLDEASVTATENAVIAAAGAKGRTVIANAASEPHVQGLCRFLSKAGVRIEGIGSNVLTVHGTRRVTPIAHTAGGDHIEAGSLIGLAAATGSDIVIKNVDPAHLRMILFQFERLGIRVQTDRRSLRVPGRQSLRIRSDLGGGIPRIEDSPWPGFPADLTSIVLVAATQSTGTCLIHEKMFESRLFFVDTLIDMGARVVLCDPHRVVVVGPSPLHSATINSPNIRAGMALLIAALAANGRSVIHNTVQIDRGYERIDERLKALGARIERQDGQHENTDPLPERRRTR